MYYREVTCSFNYVRIKRFVSYYITRVHQTLTVNVELQQQEHIICFNMLQIMWKNGIRLAADVSSFSSFYSLSFITFYWKCTETHQWVRAQSLAIAFRQWQQPYQSDKPYSERRFTTLNSRNGERFEQNGIKCRL